MRLTESDYDLVLRLAGQISATELARQLGRNYWTVVHAVRQILAGKFRCQLTWTPCSECGDLIAGPAGRTAHPECKRKRIVRQARERRKRLPGQSTPYVAQYRKRNPDAAQLLREQEKTKRRELWPDLPLTIRQAQLAKVHQADARDYPVTLARASARGSRWTADEDAIVLKRLGDPARDVALQLGRTLWAVRGRRVRLRSRD